MKIKSLNVKVDEYTIYIREPDENFPDNGDTETFRTFLHLELPKKVL